MERIQFENILKNNLIPFWSDLEDRDHGGFYGHVDKDLVVDKHADKGVLLNSRILWFFSAAYSLFKDEKLLNKAKTAYKFLTDICYDNERGGVYWSVTYDGTPVDTTKHAYNQSFAIYALSEYYMASGDKISLDLAYDIFNIIEEKCRDAEGYLEAFTIDFKPGDNEKLSENGVIADRTMNTLLHVLEAYTNLYKADKSKAVADKLKEIVDIFDSKIYDKNLGRMLVFFDSEYNSLIDLYSYGHDIETSWLLDRTADVLDDPVYADKIHSMTDVLVEEVKKHAYDAEKHALYSEAENGVVDKRLVWWIQAESVVGFYNAYMRHPEKTDDKKTSKDIFSFIQNNFINPKCGEWYEFILEDGTPDISKGMVHPWKCPYHNGRMCIEMCRRL